jgi:DNA polymerase-3 subunit gamma/tau
LSEPNSQSEQESIVKSEESIPLTKENLSESIQQYVEENKAIDIMAKNSLKSDFEFEGNQITYKLANPLEKDKVELEKGALLNHLRVKFNEPNLNINYVIDVQTGSSRPYTPKEKFEAMMNKNPALAKLRDKLGLDTDY